MRRTAITAIVSLGAAAFAAAYLLLGNTQSLDGLDQFMTGSMAAFEENKQRPLAPEFEFSDEQGLPLTLHDYQGKILLVNFWATWCAPCVYELPALDRLQEKLGGDDFEVLAISIDLQGMERVQPYLKNLGIHTLQPLADPSNSLARAAGAISLPTTLLLDRRGRELGRITGPAEWDDPEALAFMRHVVEQTE